MMRKRGFYMWIIRTSPEDGNERILKSGFTTQAQAEEYGTINYPEETITVIESQKLEMDMNYFPKNNGKWLWMYSTFKNEMFPYGIVVSCEKYFTIIQTNEVAKRHSYMPEFQTKTIQEWLKEGKGELREEGNFVNIKEYM